MAGAAGIFVPAYADETAAIDLSQKPVDTPTLDYLKDNNILIPQKGKWDASTKTWSEAAPIASPGSAYTITTGTETDHTFDYTTADSEGNLTHNYYKIDLRQSESGNGYPEQSEGTLTLGTSENIKWTKLDTAPEEGTPNTISIKVSETETVYYSYEYTKPATYTTVENKTYENSVTDPTDTSYKNPYNLGGGAALNNPAGSTDSIKNVLYQNNSSKGILEVKSSKISSYHAAIYGGAIYNNGELSEVIADFIGNSVSLTFQGSSYVSGFGGAIFNGGTIGNITGDFVGNSVAISDYSYGGAIYNSNTIDNITGDFIGNYINAQTFSGYGAAIYNSAEATNATATIGNITGDFIGNYINARTFSGYGAAIYNGGAISDITGNFIGNSVSSGLGGAIYNKGTIDDITGAFINNSLVSGGSGGAIYNTGTIGDITGKFISNSCSGSGYVTDGGVIYNAGTIGDITGDFINNSVSWGSGGAIYNDEGTIGDITGDFIGNSISDHGSGGAIYNDRGIIGNIKGNFIGNSSGAIYNYQGSIIGDITGDFIDNSGGAICNSGTIGDITGNFIGNSSGAIYNYQGSIIGDITGNFINNSGTMISNWGIFGNVTGDFINNSGTMVSNSGTIGNVTGYFIGNSVPVSESSSYSVYGGAIYNKGTIGDITVDFIGNSVSVSNSNSVYGGVIFNHGTIGNITGDFISNSVSGYSSGYKGGYGGVIYNGGAIGNITGDFIGNSVLGSSFGVVCVIYNGGVIGDITGDFIGNLVSGSYDSAGAIYNRGTIGDITGDFVGNSGYESGVVHNYAYENRTAKIGNITGDFINNSARDDGGAIHNYVDKGISTIGDITGNFINNSASGSGGAIYNNGTIGDITGDFAGNSVSYSGNSSASGSGGAIYNNGTIGDITGDFAGNSVSYSGNSSASGSGGAISNNGAIGDISGNFVDNTISSTGLVYTYGGAIYNGRSSILGDITGDFIKNSASSYGALGGAVYNKGSISLLAGDFVENSVVSPYNESDDKLNPVRGGAIFNEGAIGKIVNSSFINNFAKDNFAGGKAQGGAIYSIAPLNIIADAGVSEFTGNYVQVGDGEKDYQAINANLLTLTGKNSGRIVMNDKMMFAINLIEVGLEKTSHNVFVIYDQEKTEKYGLLQLHVNGDSSSLVQINNDVEVDFGESSIVEAITSDKIKYGTGGGAYIDSADDITTIQLTQDYLEITLTDTNLHLGVRDNVIDGHNLTLNSGLMSMQNNHAGVSALHKLTVVGDTNFVADVDLANKAMDRFTAEEYGKHTGNLNVSGMNLLSDAKDPKTEIYFAQEGLKDNVTSTVTEVAYTPIYKYNVRYENRDDAGYFVFDRGGSNGGNSSEAFNPAVLSSPISSVAASQATINETFKYVFEHADAFTQLPSDVRTARINANKYALYDGASTDFNGNRGSLCYDHNNKAAWFRPYATFETMNLKNGPKVDAITYGSLAGFDTDFHEHKHGWHSVGTGYIGYNGSQLSYKGVDTTMNGGVLGYTHTMYKGNFWTALTLSAGASVGESHTMYGKEDFTSLMAGVGSKTGYNFEFKEGKYILQPIMFMSYTFVNTFDYTNAAGVKINADPAHSIQLNPSIRFISNFKNGWQPYASVGMVWNVMNENNVTANNVRLPEMSMKPYVEYGVGVQRNWKDKFTAFGQAMLRNGGRNGIALTAGFRWALGKDTPHNHDKVEAPKTDRTVLKQLSPQQKMALTGKKNTTITSAKAVLKQL